MSLGNKVGRKSKFSFRNNYNPLWAKPKSLLLRDADHGGSKYQDYGWSSKKLIQYCSRKFNILHQMSCQIKKRILSADCLYGQDDLDRNSTTDQSKCYHNMNMILKESKIKLILNHAVVVMIGHYLHFSVHTVDTKNST